MVKNLLLVLFLGSAVFIMFNGGLCVAQVSNVSNVLFSVKDSNVVVVYDLLGSANESFNVELTLRRQSQPYFAVIPQHVKGDVGVGTRPGLGKQIVWHIREDIPFGLNGDDYYFVVNAIPLNTQKGGGSSSWMYYVGGALVAGAAAAVFFITSPSNKSGNGTHLPAPPTRPQ